MLSSKKNPDEKDCLFTLFDYDRRESAGPVA